AKKTARPCARFSIGIWSRPMTAPDPPSGSAATAVNLLGALQWLLARSEHSLTSRELAELLWLASRLPAQPPPTRRQPRDISKSRELKLDTDLDPKTNEDITKFDDKGEKSQSDLIDPFAPTVFPDQPASEGAAARVQKVDSREARFGIHLARSGIELRDIVDGFASKHWKLLGNLMGPVFG
ncbi:MAG: hypothetical protein EB060_11660, partial [Proteobacteria bacterium]|nr:hypothetical protein [Pseudomonadota bacterium]